uniref:CRISPR-associated protein Csx3 n=1 Tax=Thermosporothrix sp. COM3 TaxID=2490863 RepID=A0A455SK74_9CHLR|nr:hypothetical protein KTC_24620 [Thermosporothrix sp. COM3]
MFDPEYTNNNIITTWSLPAILIGGPPKAGKSVLTYNLTQELRRLDIQHYVLRANPDIEGDWFYNNTHISTVNQIVGEVREYRRWTDPFRDGVCRDIRRRHLPLIVDLGGRPRVEDNCIFSACTHAILLLKEGDEQETQKWHDFVALNGLPLLAVLYSQREGIASYTEQDSVITGTITGLEPYAKLYNATFDAVRDRVIQLFNTFSLEELEEHHMRTAPIEYVINPENQLHELDRYACSWTTNLLPLLLEQVPKGTAIAVYDRATNWVYAALALHAGTEPFAQFDARIGWITPPVLRAGELQKKDVLSIATHTTVDGIFHIKIHPYHNYLDYRRTDELAFPEPPPEHSIVISGELPLWLYTALARFYAQWDVPWIALEDANIGRYVVIASRTASHPIGKTLPSFA